LTGPPPPGPRPDTVSRGSRDKQPRAFEAGRSVRVVGEDDILLEVCAPDLLMRYLAAPNAEVKRRKDGSIRLVRLRSAGDDRGHLGDCHGRSTITTERVRNDWGGLVGSSFSLKHKETCGTWGNPAVEVRAEAASESGGRTSTEARLASETKLRKLENDDR